jgi:hypothetical protein
MASSLQSPFCPPSDLTSSCFSPHDLPTTEASLLPFSPPGTAPPCSDYSLSSGLPQCSIPSASAQVPLTDRLSLTSFIKSTSSSQHRAYIPIPFTPFLFYSTEPHHHHSLPSHLNLYFYVFFLLALL